LRAFDALHDQFVSAASAHPGQFPIVNVTGTETVKMQTKEQGELRFKVPKWSIAGWVDPTMFEGAGAASSAPEPEKPAPKAMPKAKPVDDEEF
jgi:hypothetical protein